MHLRLLSEELSGVVLEMEELFLEVTFHRAGGRDMPVQLKDEYWLSGDLCFSMSLEAVDSFVGRL